MPDHRTFFDVTEGTRLSHWVLLFSGAVVNYYHHFFYNLGWPININNISSLVSEHRAIIAGESTRLGSNYRVFTPYVNDFFISLLDSFIPYNHAFFFSYSFYEFFSILLTIFGIYCFCNIWFPPLYSLVGGLFASISLTTTMTISFSFHPWSFAEGAIIVWALIAIYHEKFLLVVFLSVVGILNRSTGLLVPTVYIVSEISEKENYLNRSFFAKILTVVLVSVIPMIIVRVFRTSPSWTLSFVIDNIANRYFNIGNLLGSLISIFSFFGFAWFVLFFNWRKIPHFVRIFSLVTVPYVLAVFLVGDPTELRLLIPLYPFIVPSVVLAVYSGIDFRT